MSGLKVLQPGLAGTIQDRGRFGAQRFGVPVAGALDLDAMRLANALVGNAGDAAVLEMRFIGPSLKNISGRPLRLAIVGAAVSAMIAHADGTEDAGPDRSFTLGPEEEVAVGPLSGSTTAMLAVAGGFDVPEVLGSRATFVRSGFGGIEGRPIAQGDTLPVANAAVNGPELALPEPYDITAPERIRVVRGPQDDHFTKAGLDTFFGAEWTVSQNADRMGMRLDGPELEHLDDFNIVSDGIVTGAIQVPGTGRPILLLSDRGTAGGYPKIATVTTVDLPALGRLGPGAHLRFAPVSAEEGARLARARREALDATISGLKPYHPPGHVDLRTLYETDLISPPSIED